MKLNWIKIEKELALEKSLYQATKESLTEFIKLNQTNQTFYAFAFDYGIDHNHFGLCFNTIEYHEELISRYSEADKDKKFEFKFNTGNWKYQFFNSENFPSIKNIWDLIVGEKLTQFFEIYENVIHNEAVSEEMAMEMGDYLCEEFENSIKNVVNRIKIDIKFEGLKKAKNFKIYYIDFHDDIIAIRDRIMN